MLAQVGSKKLIGIGSNIEPRRDFIRSALEKMEEYCQIINISPVYETAALTIEDSSQDWNLPFLNLVAEIEFPGTVLDFLTLLKGTEVCLGRLENAKWAPRVIDLDILFWGQETFNKTNLKVPHPEIEKRNFVLAPLKDLIPSLAVDVRKTSNHLTQIMGIVNLTRDSFSCDGVLDSEKKINDRLQKMESLSLQIIDIGAESTRPNGCAIDAIEEISRLVSTLEFIKHRRRKNRLFPRLSLDTRHSKTARWGIKNGVNIINDVSGMQDKDMLELLADGETEYVLTHSLSAPVDPSQNIEGDPIDTLVSWLEDRLSDLDRRNINLDRIYFDPGIGFGKTMNQSLKILKNIEVFNKYPVRILIGHSRKRFMSNFASKSPQERDFETLGISMHLISKGVDVLRVHNAELHLRAIRGFNHVAS